MWKIYCKYILFKCSADNDSRAWKFPLCVCECGLKECEKAAKKYQTNIYCIYSMHKCVYVGPQEYIKVSFWKGKLNHLQPAICSQCSSLWTSERGREKEFTVNWKNQWHIKMYQIAANNYRKLNFPLRNRDMCTTCRLLDVTWQQLLPTARASSAAAAAACCGLRHQSCHLTKRKSSVVAAQLWAGLPYNPWFLSSFTTTFWEKFVLWNKFVEIAWGDRGRASALFEAFTWSPKAAAAAEQVIKATPRAN